MLNRIGKCVFYDNDEGGGMINDISYNGMTPAQAIEHNRSVINAALDMFFGQ